MGNGLENGVRGTVNGLAVSPPRFLEQELSGEEFGRGFTFGLPT